MTELLFLRPLWLFALIPLLLLIWLIWHKQNNQHNWKQVCDPRLLKHLIIGTETKKRSLTVWIVLFYGLIAIISLAGPAWDKLPQPVFRQQSSLIILFDLSKSMQAQDIKPSRLIRARLKLLDILKQRQEGQTALIVYAGDAFVVSPLTDDTDTISQLVPSLIPSMMPSQGSRIDLAVSKALALFQQGGITEGEILLLTDEVPEVFAPVITQILNSNSFSLSILSIGTKYGAPINLLKGGFLKDSRGNIVIAKTNEQLLKQLAIRNNGRFSILSVDDSDILNLIRTNIFDNSQSERSDTEHDTAFWHEQGPWLILLLLPIVLLSFRKGLVFLLVIILMPISEPSYALDWNALWSNPNQRAKQLLIEGKNKESADLFQNSNWQAVANYKMGDYEKALELLDDKDTIDANYNRANSLTKLKRYDDALKNYNAVLKQNPEHDDALYNKKLVEDELKKQKNKNDDENNNNNNDKNDKKKQDNKDSQGADNKDGDNKDQKQNDDMNNSDEKNQDSGENKAPDSTDKKDQEKNDKKSDESEQSDTTEEDTNPEQIEEQQEQAKLDDQTNVENKEQQQAVEQWLRKIPDDPAGLMRRKFRYQYQRRNNQHNNKGPEW